MGDYKISVRAFDNDNNQVDAFITIKVVKHEPYTGSAIAMPGIIEAENYNLGGEGISYHDSDPENKGGVYRTDGVDVGEHPDGGNVIAYTSGGEWLEYNIQVESSSVYDVDVYYAAGRPGGEDANIGLALSNPENTLATGFTLPNTGAWTTYDVATITDVALTAGTHVLRLNLQSLGCNIDKLVFKKNTTVSIDNNSFENSINVYPNPSNDGIFNVDNRIHWKIYSISGAKILEGNGRVINLSTYPREFYIIKTYEVYQKLLYR